MVCLLALFFLSYSSFINSTSFHLNSQQQVTNTIITYCHADEHILQHVLLLCYYSGFHAPGSNHQRGHIVSPVLPSANKTSLIPGCCPLAVPRLSVPDKPTGRWGGALL